MQLQVASNSLCSRCGSRCYYRLWNFTGFQFCPSTRVGECPDVCLSAALAGDYAAIERPIPRMESNNLESRSRHARHTSKVLVLLSTWLDPNNRMSRSCYPSAVRKWQMFLTKRSPLTKSTASPSSIRAPLEDHSSGRCNAPGSLRAHI